MKLSQKFLILFLIFFSSLFLCLVGFIYWVDSTRARKEKIAEFKQLANNIAAVGNQLITNQNPGALYFVLKEEIEKSIPIQNLVYLRIIDQNGTVYFSMRAEEENKKSKYRRDLEELTSYKGKSFEEHSFIFPTTDYKIYDASIPLVNQVESYLLRIGFVFKTSVRINLKDILILFLFMSTLSLLFAGLINWLIVNPIEDLTLNSRKIAAGRTEDFNYSKNRNDEIGDLAKSLQYLVQQLRQKQKELAEKEKLAVLGKGTGRLFHNMSNLLNPMDYYFTSIRESAERGEFSKQFYKNLDTIEKHINLVRHDLSQLREVIPDKPIREKYPLTILIESALGRIFKPDHVTVQKLYGDKKFDCLLDPEQMTVVFFNLIQNAFQAMNESGTLIIKIFEKNNEINISFIDNGCGIEKEKQQEIFQFFTSFKKDGMGIGLSGAMEIVKNHGGSITVESTVGKGSTFTVKLPCGI